MAPLATRKKKKHSHLVKDHSTTPGSAQPMTSQVKNCYGDPKNIEENKK